MGRSKTQTHNQLTLFYQPTAISSAVAVGRSPFVVMIKVTEIGFSMHTHSSCVGAAAAQGVPADRNDNSGTMSGAWSLAKNVVARNYRVAHS